MSAPATKIKDPLLKVTDSFLQNPYCYYKELRDIDPVVWSDQGKYWIITSYADAKNALADLKFIKNSSIFASGNIVIQTISKLIPQVMPPSTSMLLANPPDHTRLRGLVNKAFTPSMVASMRDHIQKIADNLLDQVQAKGAMDIVSDYAFPLPITVIAEMLGVPKQDHAMFKEWSNDLIPILEPGAKAPKIMRAAVARKKLIKYILPLIEARRESPRDDLISAFTQAEEAGKHLTEPEMLSNIILILVAGHETTVNLISNSVLGLLTHPDQLQLLKDKPELLPNAIDEFLRWNSPVQITRRMLSEDVDYNGKKMKAGDIVVVCQGAANHDPSIFPDPEQLDITRDNANKHLAFGHGIHHCLGSALAGLEGQIAIDTLWKRMPNLKLAMDPDKVTWKRPFSLRGPTQLPVTF
jgi:cytochrome P450